MEGVVVLSLNSPYDAGIGLLNFSTERSRPRNLKVGPKPADEEVVVVLTKRGKYLQRQGLIGSNLYTCWLARRMSPLHARPHLMCEYTGPNDPSRDHPQDLSLQDLLDILPSYTMIVPESLDEGLLPFSASNAAPSVSRLFVMI